MFIVFEGLDGAGKSTLIQGLHAELSTQSINLVVTREPGGTSLGDEIRQILLRCQGEIPSPRTELLLYEAGRAQHVDYVICPALAKKQWVLCDRYSASSIAFQCGGRGLKKSDVEWLNAFATGGLEPDLYVLLDLTVSESQARREHRSPDRFEQEADEFHEKVRKAYLEMAKADPTRWCVLDASQPAKVSLDRLLQTVKERK